MNDDFTNIVVTIGCEDINKYYKSGVSKLFKSYDKEEQLFDYNIKKT